MRTYRRPHHKKIIYLNRLFHNSPHLNRFFMAKTIEQKIVFKNTTPKKVYDLYMNAKLHSRIVGNPVKISNKAGTSFAAHGGWLTGKNLHLVNGKLIVQTWRGADWSKEHGD